MRSVAAGVILVGSAVLASKLVMSVLGIDQIGIFVVRESDADEDEEEEEDTDSRRLAVKMFDTVNDLLRSSASQFEEALTREGLRP